MTQKISIIFSFFNEENCINDAVEHVSNALSGIQDLDYELIFINDSSTDDSLKLLSNKSINNKKIKVINMSRRFGHMPCVLAGLKYCEGDAAIHMDIDLQDPPEIIAKMIRKWREQNCDVVYSQREKFKNSFINNILTFFGYKILKKFNYINLEENAGDFRLISKRVIKEIIELNETSNFRFLVDFVGFKREKVLYQRQPREHGESKFGFKSVIFNFLEGALLPFSDTLIRFSFIVGFVGIAIIILLIPIMIYQIIQNQDFLSFSNLLLFGVFFLVGIQAFILSIISVYIGLIYKQTTNRPKYIVESKIGFDE
jgi:glycosyltransferase involved in cell wall biosynthesis